MLKSYKWEAFIYIYICSTMIRSPDKCPSPKKSLRQWVCVMLSLKFVLTGYRSTRKANTNVLSIQEGTRSMEAKKKPIKQKQYVALCIQTICICLDTEENKSLGMFCLIFGFSRSTIFKSEHFLTPQVLVHRIFTIRLVSSFAYL